MHFCTEGKEFNSAAVFNPVVLASSAEVAQHVLLKYQLAVDQTELFEKKDILCAGILCSNAMQRGSAALPVHMLLLLLTLYDYWFHKYNTEPTCAHRLNCLHFVSSDRRHTGATTQTAGTSEL